MHKVLTNMGISSGNVVCVVVAIGFLAFHTFLFTNISDRLQTALRRIDELELLVKNNNSTLTTYMDKKITSICLEEFQIRLDSELKNLKAHGDVKVPRLSRKIRRLEKRIEKCIAYSPRSKRTLGSRRPRSSQGGCSDGKSAALYTIWGVPKCSANSHTIHRGQMVTMDGSDYLCLPDNAGQELLRPTRKPGRGSSVDLRGVIYGDIEDVVSLDEEPASGASSKNNRTVPCALCARCGKSSSKMIVESSNITRMRSDYRTLREYYGVLMASKESKKLICLSVDAKKYENKKIENIVSSKFPLNNTVKIHPAELRCNSIYCEVNENYKEAHRVKCMVVTF